MPNVKTVWVLLKERGAEEVKASLEEVAAEARKVSDMDPTIKVSVDDAGAMAKLSALRVELRALKDAGDKSGLQDLANRLKDVASSADSPRTKLSALRMEEDALKAATDGGSNGGVVAALGGLVAAITGMSAPATVTTLVLAALATGLGGVVPGAAAATLGLASFAALGAPYVMKVVGALGDTNKQLNQVPAGVRVLVDGVKQVEAQFMGLAQQMHPLVEELAGTAIDIAKNLLPFMLPLAKAAGNAIETLLQGMDLFVTSPGFKSFMGEMTKLAGPWITAIGQGLGRITIALGKLMLALVNPEALRSFKYLTIGIADAINALAKTISFITNFIVSHAHQWAVAFDIARHDIAAAIDATIAGPFKGLIAAGDNVVRAFQHNAYDIRTAWDAIAKSAQLNSAAVGVAMGVVIKAGVAGSQAMRQAWDVIARAGFAGAQALGRAAMDIVRFFANMDSQVVHVLSSLVSQVFSIGEHIISGLLSGMQSMAGGVFSWLGSFASSVISKLASILHIGSPSRVTYYHGQMLALGLITGMDSMNGQVMAAAGRLGTAAISGTRNLHGGTAGGAQIILEVHPTGSGLDHLFMTWLASAIRGQGGDPRILVRKVKFT